MFKKVNDLALKMGVGASVFVMSALGNSAFAGSTNLRTAASNVTDNLTTLPALISYAAYVGGAGFGVAGVLKLRQHVDAPTQVALKDCLVRFAVCAMLIALPSIIFMAINTITNGASGGPNVPVLNAR